MLTRAAPHVANGPQFRSVRKDGRIGEPLGREDVARIYIRLAAAAILQSGRWKTPAMAARSSANLIARRGVAAKPTAIQNRV